MKGRLPLRLRRSHALRPDRLIWIVGMGRSGTGWLARMMGDARGDPIWNEPDVGSLFGAAFASGKARGRRDHFILASSRRSIWLRSLRSLILEGAAARFPHVRGQRCLIVKEPHGGLGVPLISEALPETRLIFALRDPRDVVASALDARRRGSWIRELEAERGSDEPSLADTDPDAFVRMISRQYTERIGAVREAFASHRGPKTLVQYEALRPSPLAEIRRAYKDLRLDASEPDLVRAVERNAWNRLPGEHKGPGRPFRKGQVGGWREDLTPEQVRTVEEATREILDEFYPRP